MNPGSLRSSKPNLDELIEAAKRSSDPARIAEIIGIVESKRRGNAYRKVINALRERERQLRAKPRPPEHRETVLRATIAPVVAGPLPHRIGPAEQANSVADRMISTLGTMKLIDTIQLWRNCLTLLGNEKKASQHGPARKLLAAIGREWERRRIRPNPDDFFRWPSTEASSGKKAISTEAWLVEGMLQYVGYKVGRTEGLPSSSRRMILREVFRGTLPPAFPPDYMDKWGQPSTALRLKQTAETLASFTRNARRRRDTRMEVAIRDWEQDLLFLYEEFYVGHFHFGWPETSI